MDGPKPDVGDQAPEVSPRNHDDGPIVAATYTTSDRFEFTPEQQREKQLDRVHSGGYPPQYQYQHSSIPIEQVASNGSQTPAMREQQQKKNKKEKQRRRRWVGWTIGLIVGIISALGAGIGIGYAIGENVSASHASKCDNSTESPTVTSGSTGIAAFDCNRDNTYASPFGASFAQDCYVSYKTNQTSYENASIIVRNFAGITVYSFEQCMDQCQQRNLQLNIGNAVGDACRAVSYYANLTYSIPAWAGNCFLKNARGMGKNWDTNSNATLTASGYLVALS